MVKHTVELIVPNARAEQFYDVMINPCDSRYSEWWPGEHLQFHIVEKGDENHLGDRVFVDERLGKKHRLTAQSVVITANRPHKIEWRGRKLGMPVELELEFSDTDDGVRLKHEVRIGYLGVGRLFDPLIKLYFNKSFQNAIEEHCKTEWHKLVDYLAK